MEDYDSDFIPKAMAIGFVSIIVVAGIGAFIEPPKWVIYVFAFCSSVWLCWLITTYIFSLLHPEWDTSKQGCIGFLVALFLVINIFAWIFW